jgi:hypothetical protein
MQNKSSGGSCPVVDKIEQSTFMCFFLNVLSIRDIWDTEARYLH